MIMPGAVEIDAQNRRLALAPVTSCFSAEQGNLSAEQRGHDGRKPLAAIAEPLSKWIEPVSAAAEKLDSGD